jgi:hypothetical protein
MNAMSKIHAWHDMQFSNLNLMVKDQINEVKLNLTTGNFGGTLSHLGQVWLVLGVCFVAEDPVRRNTFGRSSQKQCRSCHP